MNKRQKDKAKAQQILAQEAALKSAELPPLLLGSFAVPAQGMLDAVWGANMSAYPPMDTIPESFRHHSGKYQDIVSALFFNGGSLADHGLQWKPGVDKARALVTIRAWLSSFAPKHEHKTATVAWALSEWTEPLQAQAA